MDEKRGMLIAIGLAVVATVPWIAIAVVILCRG